MKKFGKLYKVGSWVRTTTSDDQWFKIKEIHDARHWVKLETLEVSFQKGHIVQLSNKDKPPRIY